MSVSATEQKSGEMVAGVAAGAATVRAGSDDGATWRVGAHTFTSRLIVGSGKYKSFDETVACLNESGAEMITVAVRRVDLNRGSRESLLSYLDTAKTTILPNTAGCYTAEEAIRYARLGREVGLGDLIKLEVIGDQKTLFPDNEATLEAARVLVKEGFTVLPYIIDDVILCKKLEDAGCAAVMPLAAPIGSGLGLRNPYNIRLILEAVGVPVIVDAGVGCASDAARVMELGVTAILMNTAIAGAREPLRMARAMRLGVEAGRESYLAGRIAKKLYATASSPIEGMLE